MCVSCFALICSRVFYEASRDLDSQPPPRSDHVEASRPRGLCSDSSISADHVRFVTSGGGFGAARPIVSTWTILFVPETNSVVQVPPPRAEEAPKTHGNPKTPCHT